MEVKVTHTLDFNITMYHNIYDVTAEVEVYWNYEDYGSFPGSWELSGYYIVYAEVSDSSDPEEDSFMMEDGLLSDSSNPTSLSERRLCEWWREIDSTVAQELEKVEPPDYTFDLDEIVNA